MQQTTQIAEVHGKVRNTHACVILYDLRTNRQNMFITNRARSIYILIDNQKNRLSYGCSLFQFKLTWGKVESEISGRMVAISR